MIWPARISGTWDEVEQQRAHWPACLLVARQFEERYGLNEDQQEIVFRYAMTLPGGAVSMELGVCNGKTSAVLAWCAARRGFEAHGIDAFVLENDPITFRAAMARADLVYRLHHGLTTEEPHPDAPADLRAVPWERPVDLLLVDAAHLDPWISADLARWLPLLRVGGVAMFHDYDAWPDPASAHAAVRAAVDRETGEWPMDCYLHGLMVKRKPR